MDIYKGPLEEKEYENVKDNEYLKLYIDTIPDRDNIVFYKIGDLDDNEVYNIRLRAILKDDNMEGQYSKWLKFITKKLGSDDEDDNKDDFVPYTADDEEKLEEAWKRDDKQEIVEFDAWKKKFEHVDMGLSEYEQRRLFYGMQYIEEGPGSKIDSGDFANFILNIGQRFDAKECEDNMCKCI